MVSTEAEYKGRINFLRLLAISARHYRLSWHVQGTFMRHLLSASSMIHDTDVTCFLTPCVSGHITPYTNMKQKIQSMIGEFEVMGVIEDSYKEPMIVNCTPFSEPPHVLFQFTAKVLVSTPEVYYVKFPVVLKAFCTDLAITDSRLYPFATDNIVLGANSLHLINVSDRVSGARMNKFDGIELIEKLVSLNQEKNIRQTTEYSSDNNVIDLFKNATLLLKSKQLVKEGFSIRDGCDLLMFGDNESCPICFEKNGYSVSLECSHRFCVDCLHKHMIRNGDACPLCRAHIHPVVNRQENRI